MYFLKSTNHGTIKISFHIDGKDGIKTKVHRFDKNHEADIKVIHSMILELMEKRSKITMDQFLAFLTFELTNDIRDDKTDDQILESITQSMKSANLGIEIASITAQIDSLPTRNFSLEISSKKNS